MRAESATAADKARAAGETLDVATPYFENRDARAVLAGQMHWAVRRNHASPQRTTPYCNKIGQLPELRYQCSMELDGDGRRRCSIRSFRGQRRRPLRRSSSKFC